MVDGNGKEKRIINALRTGVIPDVELDLFNVGREKETLEFQRCLNEVKEGNGIVKFISGEYGSGKTLMLNMVKQQAVKNGFIVSRIQISNGFHLNNVETLYYNIMHNLTMSSQNASGTDFENIFQLWINKLKGYPDRNEASNEINKVISSLNNYNGSFARVFLTYIKAKISNDNELSFAVSSWIKGEKNIPALLKARFDVKGDIDKQNSFDFLKAFVHLLTLIGYSGMVILIDELELIMNTRVDMRKSSYENLRYIVDGIGAGEFGRCMFVFAGTNDFFENSDKGIKTYYALYQRLGMVSFNGHPSASAYNPRLPVMQLGKLNFENLQALTEKIISLYSKAYGWTPKNSSESIRNWVLVNFKKENANISNINTREFVVKLVEILDILEQQPEKNIYNSEIKMVERGGVITFVNAKIT